MKNGKIKLRAGSAFAHAARRCTQKTDNGLVIEVESDCVGRSLKIATDLLIAADIGAGPQMREKMIAEIARADSEARPLILTLTYAG